MIDEWIKNQLNTYSIPGLSVAVVQDSIPILMQGYGWANLELSVPATEYSVYELEGVLKYRIPS